MSTVFWVTGFPGAGKTTFAKKLVSAFKKTGKQPILLDGDEVRGILSNDSLDASERQKLSYIYANLAIHLCQQGFIVVVATVSMFEAVRAHIKAHVATRVIFVEPGLQHLKQVNQKSLYDEVASVSEAYQKIYPDYELPESPDWHVKNVELMDSITNKLVMNYE